MEALKGLIKNALRERGVYYYDLSVPEREDLDAALITIILTYIRRYNFESPFSLYIIKCVDWLVSAQRKQSKKRSKESSLNNIVEFGLGYLSQNPAHVVERRMIFEEYIKKIVINNINNPLKIISILLYKGYDGELVFEYLRNIYVQLIDSESFQREKDRLSAKLEKVYKYQERYRYLISEGDWVSNEKAALDVPNSEDLAILFECTPQAVRFHLGIQEKVDTCFQDDYADREL